MTTLLPIKGRGALTNAAGRFESAERTHVVDDWRDEPEPAPETTVAIETAASIISRNDSPDISFDRSANPYRGCEHGCIYCYARPNHAYVGLSPGKDFETRLFAKTNAAELLEAAFAARGYAPATLVLGGVTDVYQPIERRFGITRALLARCLEAGHPVAIVTKSQLVLRDLDLLSALARRNLVKVAISLTTLDPTLARRMEPRATTPARRVEAIRQLAAAGVPTAVMTAPIVPALNDHEIEALLAAGAAAGAAQAGYVVLRLPREVADLFREWLEAHYPDRAARVMSLVRQLRGGRTYDSNWRIRQRGEGPVAAMIAQRFHKACARLGLNRFDVALDDRQFRPPTPAGGQLPLF